VVLDEVQQPAESLAGRIAYVELPPLSVLEVPAAED
jgi:predicted AAA+ superfamily ATPase